jgi:hypothetical protein
MKFFSLCILVATMLLNVSSKSKLCKRVNISPKESLRKMDSLLNSGFKSDTFVKVTSDLEVAMGYLFDEKNTHAIVRETGFGWGCVFKIYLHSKKTWNVVFESDTGKLYDKKIYDMQPFLIKDYNFDGKKDFAVFQCSKSIHFYQLHLNERNGQKFRCIPSFSSINNPVLDAENKRIYSFFDSKGTSNFYKELKWFRGSVVATKGLEIEFTYYGGDTITYTYYDYSKYKSLRALDGTVYQSPKIDSIIRKKPEKGYRRDLPPIWLERAKKRTDTDEFRQ